METRNTFDATADIGGAFLEHFGVKGMKWGKRKKEESEYSKSTFSAKQDAVGTVVKEHDDGTEEVYVSAVGTAGRFLDEDELAEVDSMAPQISSVSDKINKLADEEDEYRKKADKAHSKLRGKDPNNEEYKKYKLLEDYYLKRAETVGTTREKTIEKWRPTVDRYSELETKATNNMNAFLKEHPEEKVRYRANRKPKFGETTIRTGGPVGDDDGNFKSGINKDQLVEREIDRIHKTAKHSDLVKMVDESYYLEHYGVKGMKWGVRKRKPTSGARSSSRKNTTRAKLSSLLDSEQRANRRLKKAQKKYRIAEAKQKASLYENATKNLNGKTSEASTKSEQPKPKSVYSLTDDELRAAINRLDMEKRYSALLAERQPKSRKAEVARVINKAASEAAGELVKTGVKTGATYMVKKTMTNKAK